MKGTMPVVFEVTDFDNQFKSITTIFFDRFDSEILPEKNAERLQLHKSPEVLFC